MSSADIKSRIDAIRAELDALQAELAGASVPTSSSRYMKIGTFAEIHDMSPRTVRDYCELGMPHRGEGRNRRVLVVEAEAWLASGGPKLARMARKKKAA